MNLDPTFQGSQLKPGTAAYEQANDIYATSTYGKERNMNPGEILQPTSIEDIQGVVRYANKFGKPIAIRTGGHQYSGASSTGPNGIQLDLELTFRDKNKDLVLIRDTANDKVYIKASVSWSLSEVYDFLLANHVFMPTGQCATVHLGGHVQTGGFGMLARSFGLLGDYIRELHIVDHAGELVTVTKETHPDLFFGLLGGSPGNIGVLTHFTVEVQDDNKYKGSKGLWMAFHYHQDTLKELLDILVEKGEDPNFPRSYDFTVNVVSRETNLLDLFPGTEEDLKEALPDNIHDGKTNFANVFKFKYAVIVVYAQWVNLGIDKFSPDLFNRIKGVKHDLFKFAKETDENASMSYITSMWLFRSRREFPYPYIKRTNTTNSTTLSKTGWSKWFSGRIEEIISNKHNGLWVSSQLQVYGGKASMFANNANNGTAYSWRDATISGTWDLFHQNNYEGAKKWQDENDAGAATYFSKDDRRVLWGSYGDWDMKKVWPHYYDTQTYEKLRQVRKKADPNGVFTANPFCVEAAEKSVCSTL
ncbi:hypothetical protein TGAMA5MH_08877 [Trichoderma gamsii]|uniref:FAD-binding PCMH-type domain-containing protein n=1 Tax=Trichoderma gamsii TaxID=398673 RepID=A0A2K0T114_9HYPO|nr:hypothetical protein TGAMA5MH_08877 [Trichoderma gamsii]